MISTQGIKADRLALSPEEMMVDKIREFPVSAICALMGTNAMTLGFPDPGKTYSNYEVAVKASWENGLIPRMARAAEAFDRQCPELIKPNQRLKWDYSHVKALQNDWNKKIDGLVKAAGGPIMTRNEAREQIHLDPQEGGDEITTPQPAALPGVAPQGQLPKPKPKDEPTPTPADGKSFKKAEDDGDPFDRDASLAMVHKAAVGLGLLPAYLDGTIDDEQRRALLHRVSEMAADILKVEGQALLDILLEEMPPEDGKGFFDDLVGGRLSPQLANLYPAKPVPKPVPPKEDRPKFTAKAKKAIGDFFGKALKIVKTASLAAAFALMGPQELTVEESKVLAGQVVAQEAYLKNFQRDLENGHQPIDGTLPARAAKYGGGIWQSSVNTVRVISVEFGQAVQERRIYDPLADNCTDCPPLARIGWVAVGTLPSIGDTECNGWCRCYFAFRDADENEWTTFELPAHMGNHRQVRPDHNPRAEFDE
jgi:hypothetical protein